MTDFKNLSKKIFDSNPSIRSTTFSRFDGLLLHSQMREGVESLNPFGEIERMESEVLVPTLSGYFEDYKQYLGKVDYMGAKFEKVSMLYMKHRNIFAIVSVEPGFNLTPIAHRIKEILEAEVNGNQS